MKKILLLIPLMLLMGACDYYGFVMIRNGKGVPERYDLDVVRYCLWSVIAIDCFFILSGNKKRQDRYRKMIDSIGKEEDEPMTD